MTEGPTTDLHPLCALLGERRVVVCVGAGGVGKTTVSAALGVAAARQGRRALVLTVDPARRLANALGLTEFAHEIQHISAERFAECGISVRVGLDVAMLDVKSTFDRVVLRNASSEASARLILDNAFYQQASTALAGSQEYMAMQRLYEVVVEKPYDVVILDTPPSAHALDFLDAPRRMIELFGSRRFRKLLRGFGGGQAGGGGRMFRPDSLLMRGLGKFTSADMFHNLLSFFAALSDTFDGFVQGAQDVLALLHSPQTAFVIVSAPDEGSTFEGLYLHQRLLDEQMEVGAWVLNRVRQHPDGPADRAATLAELRAVLADDQQAEAVAQAAAAIADMASTDERHRARLARRVGEQPPILSLPYAEVEPATLSELELLAITLCQADASNSKAAP